MRIRVVWASLFLEEFYRMIQTAGNAVVMWYWTDSIVRKPNRAQLDAIVELKEE